MLGRAVASAESPALDQYYPRRPLTVRWYAVKNLQSGAAVTTTSFALVFYEPGPSGHPIWMVENRTAGGVTVDYQELTADQLQLHRTLTVATGPTIDLRVGRFVPPLPMLRAPLEVGRTWSETPQGDQPYTYRIESRSTLQVRGKEIADCLRVVRTRGGTVDYKADYCPGIGIAAFEILSGGTWLHGDLTADVGEVELIGLKASYRGCEHIFVPQVQPGLPLTVTVAAPGQPTDTSQSLSGRYINIVIPTGAPPGIWRIDVAGPYRNWSAQAVIWWSGACRADFLTPRPAMGPSVAVVQQEAMPGRVMLSVVGVGWKPGEPLTVKVAGPGWYPQTIPFGTANQAGVSQAGVVPFPDVLPRGTFTITMEASTQTATLTVVCEPSGFCAPSFLRKRPDASPPSAEVLAENIVEIARAMNLKRLYEDRAQGIFVWQMPIAGLPADCHALFGWYVKRAGRDIALDDPGILRCTTTDTQSASCEPCSAFAAQLHATQEEFKRRWRNLVEPGGIVGPSQATHSPAAITDALMRADATAR